jgi:hypothetical protein
VNQGAVYHLTITATYAGWHSDSTVTRAPASVLIAATSRWTSTTFTPDNAWSIALHDNDYSDADSHRKTELTLLHRLSRLTRSRIRPERAASGRVDDSFQLDQLFNYAVRSNTRTAT